jgi:flagellar hook-associated protein 1
VTTSFDARGAVTVRVAGSGDALVDSGSVATVVAVIGADGSVAFALTSPTSAAITPSSGSLAGLTDASHHIAALSSSVDVLAGRVATDLNAAHQAGLGASGNPGAALFAFGGNAAFLTAVALNANDVAAADASSANGNVLNFANLRGPSGVEQAWAAIVNAQAQTTASARAQDAATGTRYDGATAARDAISEVDIDREAADLLRFQQAYEAAARTIQVARETMQSILNIF